MKYEYWKGPKRVWAWHLKASNGHVVAQGGGYPEKSDVLHAIELVKLSRPGELNVRQSRRHCLSIAAFLALTVALGLSWMVADIVLPRWDGSYVVVDAAVVHTEQSGTGRKQRQSTTVRFSVPDGRVFTPTIKRSSAEMDATNVRIRYNPNNPKDVLEDSGTSTYSFALNILIVDVFFLVLAYAASLYSGDATLEGLNANPTLGQIEKNLPEGMTIERSSGEIATEIFDTPLRVPRLMLLWGTPLIVLVIAPGIIASLIAIGQIPLDKLVQQARVGIGLLLCLLSIVLYLTSIKGSNKTRITKLRGKIEILYGPIPVPWRPRARSFSVDDIAQIDHVDEKWKYGVLRNVFLVLRDTTRFSVGRWPIPVAETVDQQLRLMIGQSNPE